jgi:hypothetical protein
VIIFARHRTSFAFIANCFDTQNSIKLRETKAQWESNLAECNWTVSMRCVWYRFIVMARQKDRLGRSDNFNKSHSSKSCKLSCAKVKDFNLCSGNSSNSLCEKLSVVPQCLDWFVSKASFYSFCKFQSPQRKLSFFRWLCSTSTSMHYSVDSLLALRHKMSRTINELIIEKFTASF